jgi:hypothetical protein
MQYNSGYDTIRRNKLSMMIELNYSPVNDVLIAIDSHQLSSDFGSRLLRYELDFTISVTFFQDRTNKWISQILNNK